jgi:hypothetical protein
MLLSGRRTRTDPAGPYAAIRYRDQVPRTCARGARNLVPTRAEGFPSGKAEAPSNSNNLLDQNWTKWFQEEPENSGHFWPLLLP